MEDDGGCIFVCDVDKQLKQAQKKVIERLEGGLGIKVTPIKISKMKFSLQIWITKMSTSGAKTFCELMGQGEPTNPYKEFLKWLVRSSDHTLPALVLGMSESLASPSASLNKNFASICDELEEEFQAILGGDGVLLYPSQPRLAPYHNQAILMPFNFAYTGIFNVLGVPVTQCPVGLSTEGLPMGIQVVGAHKNDRLTIAVANEISRMMGGWVPHT